MATANHLGLVVLTNANASHSIAKKSCPLQVTKKTKPKNCGFDGLVPSTTTAIGWNGSIVLYSSCICLAGSTSGICSFSMAATLIFHVFKLQKQRGHTHTDMRRFKTHGNVYAVSKDTGWSLGL